MTAGRILINGSGLGGLSCAALLHRAGWQVEVQAAAPVDGPTLVLNAVTCGILGDIWQAGPDLFSGAHLIAQRLTRWGQGDQVAVPVHSLAIASRLLTERLLIRLIRDGVRVRLEEQAPRPPMLGVSAKVPFSSSPSIGGRGAADGYNWIVAAGSTGSPLLRDDAGGLVCGRRVVLASDVALRHHTEPAQAWLESTSAGWVFLAPLDDGRATLQIMLPAPPPSLAQALGDGLAGTTAIRHMVEEPIEPPVLFAAAPAIAASLCCPGLLAVGGAALRLDPLCGDGTGHAARSAILAAGVIGAVAAGERPGACLQHYRQRLLTAFRLHIEQCRNFYSSLPGVTWADELRRMATALAALPQPPSAGQTTHRLAGFRLLPV